MAVSDESQVASPVKPVKPVLELWSPTHIGRYRLSSYGLLCVEAGFGDVHVSIPLWYIVTNCRRLYKNLRPTFWVFLFRLECTCTFAIACLIPAATFLPLDVNLCPATVLHRPKNYNYVHMFVLHCLLLSSFFLHLSSTCILYIYTYTCVTTV